MPPDEKSAEDGTFEETQYRGTAASLVKPAFQVRPQAETQSSKHPSYRAGIENNP
jgi:hypothetical protein